MTRSELGDEALMDLVQRATLRYFWEYGHPVSGMARERSGGVAGYDISETVATGGTGFGIMAMIAGAERGFLPQNAVVARIAQIAAFLENSPRYRGAFPHWLNGTTGQTIAFSGHDDGGDIVETAFLMMGLLTARQYIATRDPQLALQIDRIWREVDWAGYCDGPDRLMWHWSPRHDWVDALPITGWHEGLIAFVLAAASPTHPIGCGVYERGWKNSSTFTNGQTFHDIELPLGPDYGGPLFFAHYSFLGLDPTALVDDDADYWVQNCNHARIHHAYCTANPKGFSGYGPAWGLTACEGPNGYSAFSPMHDGGVIAPTAAIGSILYTPTQSLAAMRHYFTDYDGALWGEYGFHNSFSPSTGWVSASNLAIDQGPIVCMIENFRTGLLWRLFMSVPEVQLGLRRLGFLPPRKQARLSAQR